MPFGGLGFPRDLYVKPTGGHFTLLAKLKTFPLGSHGQGMPFRVTVSLAGFHSTFEPLKMCKPLKTLFFPWDNGGASKEGSAYASFPNKLSRLLNRLVPLGVGTVHVAQTRFSAYLIKTWSYENRHYRVFCVYHNSKWS